MRALEARGDRVRSLVCVTGQHRELLEPVLRLFEIRADFDLAVMRREQTLGQLTGALFSGIDEVLAACGPDWVLAQGDTTSTMVAAMSAYYRRCRFGHVEAGLRTGDRWRPFPEEANRYVADYVADLMFAPTEHSRRALLAEGHPAERILVTGNTVVDALWRWWRGFTVGRRGRWRGCQRIGR